MRVMTIRMFVAPAFASVLAFFACDSEDAAVFRAHVDVPQTSVALRGLVVDALTGEPIAGARVRALEGEASPDDPYAPAIDETMTNGEGRFYFEHRAGEATHLAVTAGGYFAELVRVPQLEDEGEPVFAIFPARDPTAEELANLGPRGTGADAPDEGAKMLENAEANGGLTIGGGFQLPLRVRVGRTFTTSGGSCPAVRAVEEMPLEEYVKGVVASEVGVFRWTSGGDRAAEAAYKTMAVAARSYVLYFYLLNPAGYYTATINGRSVRYHINDTACHQRYADARHAAINAAVNATRGEVLVNQDRRSVDKYEYAASCGRHGTQPEHRTTLVDDRPGLTACVGSWCGHDSCAGHSGCLVRGICQWGTLERSKRGDAYSAILTHYQPELVRLRFGGSTPEEDPPPPDMDPPPPMSPAPPERVTVDNTATNRFRASSGWETSSWASGKIGTNYRYRSPQNISDPAEYKIDIPTAGSWEVFARVPGDGYNTDNPYIITHRGGSTTVRRNISGRGGEWISLGTFDFEAKDDWIVKISCWTGGRGYVIADAVRFEKR